MDCPLCLGTVGKYAFVAFRGAESHKVRIDNLQFSGDGGILDAVDRAGLRACEIVRIGAGH